VHACFICVHLYYRFHALSSLCLILTLTLTLTLTRARRFELVGNLTISSILFYRAQELDRNCSLASYQLWARAFRTRTPQSCLEFMSQLSAQNPVIVVGTDVWRWSLLRMPTQEAMPWRPPAAEDYYWPRLLYSGNKLIFQHVLHPLCRSEEELEAAQQTEEEVPFTHYTPGPETDDHHALEW
jgi:hypothetical protein